MSNFYDLLQNVKRRPGMYLGEPSLTRLHSFLAGYRLARNELGIAPTNQEQQLAKFQPWLAEKFQVTTSQSWSTIILSQTGDEAIALTEFFELLDQFWQEQNQHVWQTEVRPNLIAA